MNKPAVLALIAWGLFFAALTMLAVFFVLTQF